MAKRSFADFASSSDPTLTILTADGAKLPAHAEVLRLVFGCLKNAPCSNEWDLRQLLIDGTPASGDTVTLVLEFIYDNMRAMDLVMDKTPGRLSLLQLRDMLLFADAVGCSSRLLQDMASLLDVCVRQQLEVQLPDASGSSRPCCDSAADTSTVTLQLGGVYALNDDGDGGEDLIRWQNDQRVEMIQLNMNSNQQQQLKQAVAQQLESLLYAAFKLDLARLAAPLLCFVRNNSVFNCGLLFGESAKDIVFSSRMLAVAGGSIGGQLLTRTCLQRPLGRGFGIGIVFDVDESSIRSSGLDIHFDATLLRQLYDYSKGTTVGVDVDLREGRMTITVHPYGDDEDAASTAQYCYGVVLGNGLLFDGPDLLGA